jgi:membrane dipeptidase
LRWVKALYPTRDPIFTENDFDVAVGMLERIEEVVADALDPETGESLGVVARSVDELDAVVNHPDDERIVLVHSIEGAHTIDGNLSNLDRLFELGVAYMTLAHFYENGVAAPVFPFPEDMQALGCFRERRDLTLGLTGLGEQVVERMNELGMLIDVTHCTPVARRHVYNIVQEKAPLLATHVGTYEINPNPYNISDDETRLIADSGGLIGVIFMNYWLAPYTRKRGIDFVVQTIQHFVDVAGIEHIGIGSDFDGFTDPPDDLKDASYLPFLTQRLVAEGFTDVGIHKLLGGNALRVLRDGWGKRT